MRQALENLFRVHKLDASIKALEERKSRFPAELAEIEAVVTRAEGDLAAIREKRRALEKSRRVLEQQVEDANQSIKKHQRQAFEVKTNKEYSAMLQEIESEKRRVSETEERILALMEEAEELALAEQQAVDMAGRVRRESESRRSELQILSEQVESELIAAFSARQELLKSLPQDILTLYLRVFKGRNGVAVVPVVGGTCGGCFANLPTKVTVEVRTMEELVTCEACGRILVWGGEDAASPKNTDTA